MASDVPAILKYTRNVYYIGNLEFAKLVPGEAHFYDLNGDEIEKQTTEIKWDAEAAEKGGFEHFMMKEIHEQPKVVGDTINSVVKEDFIDLTDIGLSEEDIKKIKSRGAYLMGLTTFGRYDIEDTVDFTVYIPKTDPLFATSLAVIPLQLLGYYILSLIHI